MKGYTEIISDVPDKSTKSTQEKSEHNRRLSIQKFCMKKQKHCTNRQNLRTKKFRTD